jgi:Arc/MetJ family transcription regulator
MYSNMKTTVDIQDALLDEARKIASQERTTVKAMVEEGLRKVLAERKGTKSFQLRKVTFKGNGLQPQVSGGSWKEIRDLAYEGRGS